jgi:hypothetical protein
VRRSSHQTIITKIVVQHIHPYLQEFLDTAEFVQPQQSLRAASTDRRTPRPGGETPPPISPRDGGDLASSIAGAERQQGAASGATGAVQSEDGPTASGAEQDDADAQPVAPEPSPAPESEGAAAADSPQQTSDREATPAEETQTEPSPAGALRTDQSACMCKAPFYYLMVHRARC